MTEYRCYFFNANGHIVAAEDIVTDSDDDALSRAKVGFAQNENHAAFELWQGQRRMHRGTRGSETTTSPGI